MNIINNRKDVSRDSKLDFARARQAQCKATKRDAYASRREKAEAAAQKTHRKQNIKKKVGIAENAIDFLSIKGKQAKATAQEKQVQVPRP